MRPAVIFEPRVDEFRAFDLIFSGILRSTVIIELLQQFGDGVSRHGHGARQDIPWYGRGDMFGRLTAVNLNRTEFAGGSNSRVGWSIMSKTTNKFSPEVRDRAVRLASY